MSIEALVEQMATGQASAEELVESCLRRIDRFEAQVHAWVEVDGNGARASARKLDQSARDGKQVGPLHGIPIGIKDIIDVQGMPTRAGSPLRALHVADADASVVQRLKSAGAVILGKTVTTEFACFDPPSTRNPWNLNHTPGGSSSGSAAGVALGMCMAAVGSQTGGSITRPASYCGVAGLKPRYGTISADGVVPVSTRLDHVGPIAPCVADLAVMFQVMADSSRKLDETDSLKQKSANRRLGVLRRYFLEHATPDVRAAIEAAIQSLSGAGADVIEVRLPTSFDQVHAMHRRIMAFDVAKLHGELYQSRPDQFGTNLSGLIEQGLSISTSQYELALEHQRRFQLDCPSLFADVNVLLTPSTDSAAPLDLTTTGDPRFNSPWSFAGLATVTLPCGMNDAGLPIGLQLIGADSETKLLAAASWCEDVIAFSERPEILRSLD